jgi:hypothetical protein
MRFVIRAPQTEWHGISVVNREGYSPDWIIFLPDLRQKEET